MGLRTFTLSLPSSASLEQLASLLRAGEVQVYSGLSDVVCVRSLPGNNELYLELQFWDVKPPEGAERRDLLVTHPSDSEEHARQAVDRLAKALDVWIYVGEEPRLVPWAAVRTGPLPSA